MSHIEKEKLIRTDIASIENRVRHAFNQGYDLGFKDGKEKAKPLEQETQTFKWCTDCKEYDQEKHCCHRWSKVIRDTVEEMKQEPRWIPVSERLPEENMDVLVVVEFPDGKDGTLQRIEIASFGSMYHLSSEKGWITNNFTRITRTEVKAWMPLPERYKAESEET